MIIKNLLKHRKKLALFTLAAMAFKSFDKSKDEDEEIVKAKQILEDKGYKISKTNKAIGSVKYAQQFYQDNPQLVNQALKIIKKLGKF